MDRLTCKNIEGWNVLCDASNFDKNGKVKDTQQCDEVCSGIGYCGNCPIQNAINKLADYEDQEEQGLLLKLPCKLGTPVWTIVTGTTCKNPSLLRQDFELYMLDHFGKSVFLTREEAEQVFTELKGGQNG